MVPEQARRVRAARAYAGLSRARLAAACGWSPHALAQGERGERMLAPAELDAIARACEVTLDFLTAGCAPRSAPEDTTQAELPARLRALRDRLDRALEAQAQNAEVVPFQDETAKLLAGLDPSFEGLDPRLVRALEHPLRTRLLNACTGRPRTPEELSAELRVPPAAVREQLEILVAAGALQLDERSGQPTYQAVVWHHLDDRQVSYFPVAFRRRQYAYILEVIEEDVRAAMPSGGFDSDSVHASRAYLRLDERGYDDVVALLVQALHRVLQINAESDARRTYGETEEEIETELAILHFHRDPSAPPARTAAAE